MCLCASVCLRVCMRIGMHANIFTKIYSDTHFKCSFEWYKESTLTKSWLSTGFGLILTYLYRVVRASYISYRVGLDTGSRIRDEPGPSLGPLS